MARKPELVKLFLHQDHDDVESVWAVKLGKTRGGTLLRLDNIPFMHARPTYGDVVVAKADRELEVPYAWNGAHIRFSDVPKHLHEDGGRYAAITYKLIDPSPANSSVRHRAFPLKTGSVRRPVGRLCDAPVTRPVHHRTEPSCHLG